MSDEKRYSEDQLEKIGELRASIKFAQLQKDSLRRFAEIPNRGVTEETWVGALALGCIAAMGLAQLYYYSGTVTLGYLLSAFGLVAVVFWTYRRRAMSRARELELLKAELELENAIKLANEAIREAKADG